MARRSLVRWSGLMAAAMAAAIATGSTVSAQALDPVEKRLFEDGIRRNIDTYVRLNPVLDARGVSVDVNLTTVTLRGDVPTQRDHGLMLQAAQTTYGVYKVVDELTVRAADPNAPNVATLLRRDPSMTGDVNLAERQR